MNMLARVKGLFVATLSAVVGAGAFYALAFSFMYFVGFILRSNQAEAAPPLWVGVLLIATYLGMAISAVLAGFWGYFRYCNHIDNTN